MEQPERVSGLLPESHGQNLAVTVLYVPCSAVTVLYVTLSYMCHNLAVTVLYVPYSTAVSRTDLAAFAGEDAVADGPLRLRVPRTIHPNTVVFADKTSKSDARKQRISWTRLFKAE